MRSDKPERYIAEYVWEGGRLIREINPDRTTTFLYDGDEIAGFSAGGSNYYYAKDSFGVISYVYNEDGSLYASYKYDAWGSLITSASTLPASGDINPIRYKSYYYDADTGFYYLQSRYYDPFVGRFLNADDAAYLGISGTVLGWNMFAYCENSVLNYSDEQGCLIDSTFIVIMLLQDHLAKTKIWRCFPGIGDIQFYLLVKNNGEWDYKTKKPFWARGGYFRSFGIRFSLHDFGNFHYGFTGASMFYSPATLYAGGGFVAMRNRVNWSNAYFFFDDKDDHFWIAAGILAYSFVDPSYFALYSNHMYYIEKNLYLAGLSLYGFMKYLRWLK